MRINMIATPRNLSTAMMYAFGQRSDTTVVDEPYYAYWLVKTGARHPGRTATIQSQEIDIEKIEYQLLNKNLTTPNLFIKNMAKHIEGLPLSHLKGFRVMLLLRDPRQLIASFAKVIPDVDDSEIGLVHQFRIFEYIRQETGSPPLCFDTGELLKDPPRVMRKLCEALDLPFDSGMLSWEAGPRPEDGVWAQYWYANVHKSTGFTRQITRDSELPAHCRPLYEELLPFYQQMYEHAIMA